MRLGLDGTPLLPPRSGVGYYTSRLLAAMLRQEPGWRFCLYGNRPLESLEPALDRAQRLTRAFPFSRWLWMQAHLPDLIAWSGADLCHFTNSLAPLRAPTPYVLTIHDASLYACSQYHPRSRLLAHRSLLPALVRRAAAIITVSHHASRELQRHLGIPAAKIHVVHEAAAALFRPEHDPERQRQVRARYGVRDPYILYVGTLEPRKNLARLVRAFAQMRRQGLPHQLVLVGSRGWRMESFYRQLQEPPVADAVRLPGYVPLADLPALYSGAALFAFPSLYEGFGLPVIEAMACGAAVLTSDRGALREVTGDAAAHVDPTDEAELGRAMAELLASPALLADLRERGRRRAALFSWDRAARETTAIYDQVLSGAANA